ncbi:MAG TPA: GYF domain-containing protein [Candidatus Methylacidiphilales bacterium]|nr:GYF domain-containing protein [Candidatus Methylacidiphilales bacterium]
MELLEEQTQLGAWAFMEYFILKPDGEQTGTYSIDQVRAMLNSGFIGPDARYWHEGISEWQPIERIEESINYPEPDPRQLHAPPPPQKWTGSLARAIPSPRQQKQKSGPIEVAAPSPTAPEIPAVPGPLRPAVEIPAPTLRIETAPPDSNGAASHEPTAPTISREQAKAAVPRSEPRRPFRLPLPSAAQICAVGLILLAAAIIAAIVASRHPAKSAFSQVTLTARNDCVLTDQAAIPTFEYEMHRAPFVAHLKDVIAKSTDRAFIQSANTGLQQEIQKHESEVTQQFLKAGRAQLIEPGAYRAVAYFDDRGSVVAAHAGAPWAAILCKGTIVYAYLGSDFQPRPQ